MGLDLPLPIFSCDLADWRSFWARCTNYIGKDDTLTDAEKLCYLADCLHDDKAKSIVKEATRNREDFKSTEAAEPLNGPA